MTLPSLPLDVLLAVLRDLDIVDVVRTGMTCKDLYVVIQDRHVWVDQLEKLRRKDPALRSATPPLTSLSAEELKNFVTGRVKLRLRWDKDDNENGFAAEGLIGIPGVCQLRLLPGGKFVLIIDSRGGVTLHRIKLEDGQVSLSVVANIKYDKIVVGCGWSKLLTTVSPCPILIHKQGNDIHLLRVDHHNCTISLEATFPIPEGYGFLQVHGQGRAVGFLIQRIPEPPRVDVIHLDYPGASMVYKVSPTYIAEAGLSCYSWNICIPTESLVIIYCTRRILAYKIPSFSSLTPGINLSNPTPTWSWPGPAQVNDDVRILASYATGEVLYDPPYTREFNLHYVCNGYVQAESFAITITMPISTEGDFASEPPALKQKSTPIPSHGLDSFGFSCRKGLHSDTTSQGNKLDILVTPLDDLVLEGGRGALRMTVSYRELTNHTRTTEVDMDEATGRVVIWGWDRDTGETKVLVGDLV